MKITLNVDDALLSKVMEAFGTTNKTEAIDLALRDVGRRARLIALAEEGMGLSPEELGGLFDPNYDLMASRIAEGPALYRTRRNIVSKPASTPDRKRRKPSSDTK